MNKITLYREIDFQSIPKPKISFLATKFIASCRSFLFLKSGKSSLLKQVCALIKFFPGVIVHLVIQNFAIFPRLDSIVLFLKLKFYSKPPMGTLLLPVQNWRNVDNSFWFILLIISQKLIIIYILLSPKNTSWFGLKPL